ncbi:MAG: hypothetical protein WC671_00040 [Candidatus Paceibacterota bacterium]|jgi:hypothetical protein
MPPDQNSTQKQNSEENSIPPSSQEPMADVPIPATDPSPTDMPLEAPESPKNADIHVSLNNANPENTIETMENKDKIEEIEPKPENILKNQVEVSKTVENTEEIQQEPEKPLETNISAEPIPSEAIPASSTPTAQMAGNEPLSPKTEPLQTRAEATPPPVISPTTVPSEIKTEPKHEEIKQTPIPIPIPIIIPKKNSVKELLIKAKNAIQFRKRKKLDKVMALFLKHSKITNDEVEKFLHVSDATATRYLSQLKKEGKIKQSGKTGHAVSYIKI